MNKILKRISYTLGMCALAFTAVSCDDEAEELTSVEYDRLFAPTELEIRIQDRTNIRASWGCLSDADAQSYTIELFADDPNMACEGTATETYTDIKENPYVITGLAGETTYSFRIKAVGESKESNWTTTVFTTEAEQIFQAVSDADITATTVTLRWIAGEEASTITVTPTQEGSTAASVTYTVTAEDIANGYATIENLTPETDYEAVLKLDNRTRGTIEFTTSIDTGGMTLVAEGDDLVAAIEADQGAGLFLTGSNYEMGNYTLTKAIAIAAAPTNKPSIHGRFVIGSAIGSLTLTNLIFDGQGDTDNILELKSADANLGTLTIEGCEIRNMGKHIMYNNAKGTFGNIVINNCIIDGIDDGGGDGFDLRGGALQSLTVSNTTISNGVRTLLRCQVASTTNVTFQNCTFYNICTLDNSNNNGLFQMDKTDESSLLTVKNCLFYGIGTANPSATESGSWGRSSKFKASAAYSNNYYYNCPNLWASLYKDDHSAVATEADPGFADAANGDFTISNEDMIYYQVGDPRWY